MDKITYEKKEDGSILKVVFHEEESKKLDEQIANLKKSIPELENRAQQARDLVAQAYEELENAEAQNAKQIFPDVITVTHTETVSDCQPEIAAIEATLTNLKAGTTEDSEEQKKIDEAIKNYEEQLIILKS